MSIRLMSAVWERAPFKDYTLMALLALADSAGDEGWCWPKLETLAAKTRLAERTLYQALSNLIESGWLAKEVNSQDKRRVKYRVIIPAQAAPIGEQIPAQRALIPAPHAEIPAPHANPPNPLIGRTVKNRKEPTTMLIRPWKPTERQCESVYDEYPRKVGRQKALKAIYRALIEEAVKCECDPPEEIVAVIRERTQDFAKSWAGHQEQYTPHPTTWFNAGRYFDDQKEWEQPKR